MSIIFELTGCVNRVRMTEIPPCREKLWMKKGGRSGAFLFALAKVFCAY